MVGKHAVLLQDYNGDLRPSDIKLDSMMIWVHILNLSLGWMNEKRGVKIAGLVGVVDKIDVHGDVLGTHSRARVAIPIDKPITLRRWVCEI